MLVLLNRMLESGNVPLAGDIDRLIMCCSVILYCTCQELKACPFARLPVALQLRCYSTGRWASVGAMIQCTLPLQCC